MTGVQFADGFDGPDRIALGLGAPQLATVVAGGLGGYALLHAPGPAVVRLPVAGLLAVVAATLGWGRIAGRPLLHWCWLAARFAARPRRGGGVLLAAGDSQDGEPPWARWLRQGGARRGGEVAGDVGVGEEEAAPPAQGDSGGPPEWTVEDSVPATVERETHAEAAQAVDDELATIGRAGGRQPDPRHRRRPSLAQSVRARWRRRGHGLRTTDPSTSDAAAPPIAAAPRLGEVASSRTVEIDRPSIVLLPEPLSPDRPAADEPTPPHPDAVGDGDEVESEADVGRDHRDVGADDEPGGAALLRLPRRDDDDDSLPAAEPRTATAVDSIPPTRLADAPVFVGATRRITFFSLNGGSGRTTLATEVACLLAARGAHRESGDTPPQPLSVALLDLDLRSANVAMRLGVPQPTILDYLLDGGEDPAAVRRYLVRHPSGLRVLLGPPKPLGQSGPGLEPARVAEIVHQLERDGAHFIVIDIGADLGAVTTWVLTAVHDIYVVIRPTASGVQDAYRSTEALRRLGLGHKLRYVVNRVRGPLDVDEVMADLGGRVAATIPDDPRVEDAENRHRQVALDGQGPAAAAIVRLAAEIYPGLRGPARRGRFSRLRRRRVG